MSMQKVEGAMQQSCEEIGKINQGKGRRKSGTRTANALWERAYVKVGES